MNPGFNLIDRPWITAQRPDGAAAEVSLLQLLTESDSFVRLGGDLPTQPVTILRLALAILHRAVEGPDQELWRTLWKSRTLPAATIGDYLEDFRERFDLLHSETPFYQVADLKVKREESPLSAFIADVPVGNPKYAMRTATGIERIGFAEAARWTVHCHAFDLSGIKGAADGDPRAKGGKSYPIGPGTLGRVGAIYPEGKNLTETLLLNLIPDEFLERYGDLDPDDVPVWEREPHSAEPEKRQPEGAPKGLLDLYTWQSRRLRLVHDEDGVTGAVICQGDKLDLTNLHATEPMAAWRRSENQERKLKLPVVYLPRRHDPTRNVWRGLASALPATTGSSAGKDASIAPLVLHWIGAAQHRHGLDPAERVKFHATGIDYGTQEAVISDLVDDRLTVAAAVFDAENRELAATVTEAVSDADDSVRALSALARDLARAAGDRDGVAGAGAAAGVVAYAALDTEYRAWLAGLTPATDTDQARTAWQHRVYATVRAFAVRQVAYAGAAAWKGRKDGDFHLNTPNAENAFGRRIRKALPLVFPERTDDEESD